MVVVSAVVVGTAPFWTDVEVKVSPDDPLNEFIELVSFVWIWLNWSVLPSLIEAKGITLPSLNIKLFNWNDFYS